MRIPSGSLCGGERFRRTTAFLNLFISLRKIILLKQRGLCEPSEITEILSIVNVEVSRVVYCSRMDFVQKAKSRGGTLVTRPYIKESTYS